MKMKPNRLFLALATAATLALALPALAAAWTPPSIDAHCADDQNSLSWTVTLSGEEPSYDFDWSFDSGFADATTVDGAQGANDLTTPRGGATLYVRWSSDHGSKASEPANTELCDQTEPTPTASIDPFSGSAGVVCDPDQDPGYILEWSADNTHGDATIEVHLFLNGQDSGVAPMVLAVGHKATRFVDYDHVQQVALITGETVLFDEILALPACGPGVTIPPTSSADQVAIAPASVDLSVSAVLLLIGGLGIIFIALGRRRRTD